MYNVSLFIPSMKGCSIIIATETISVCKERRNVSNNKETIKRLIIGFPTMKQNNEKINMKDINMLLLTKDFVYEWFPFLNINTELSYYSIELTGTLGDIMKRATSIIDHVIKI